MNEELFRNKLMIDSPTSISLGHITWFALDTKLVGRVKALLEERDNLQSKIDKSDELIETYKNERDIYKRLAETYIKKYNDSIRELVLYETILGDKNETIDFYKARIKKAIKELNNRDYDDGDFESMKFQNHVINILEGDEE